MTTPLGGGTGGLAGKRVGKYRDRPLRALNSKRHATQQVVNAPRTHHVFLYESRSIALPDLRVAAARSESYLRRPRLPSVVATDGSFAVEIAGNRVRVASFRHSPDVMSLRNMLLTLATVCMAWTSLAELMSSPGCSARTVIS